MENAQAFSDRADNILKAGKLQDYISLEVNESVEIEKKYKGGGRPAPNAPFDIIEIHKLSLSATNDTEAVDQYLLSAGWRIYVTDTPADMMTLLTITLQVLTTIEFVSRKEPEKTDESISGPGKS
ncbi:hypothetical protein QUF90_21155 [Desulfococcaceae bacterium HSG9]|nr:hypothetical protein [Desulfococcaceae bacterium HSG9]